MKIREGFVSNSSTTSFCIAGIYTNNDNISEKVEEPEWLWKDYFDGVDGLQTYEHPDSDGDDFYVGINIHNMEEGETLGEFKLRAKEVLKEYFKETEVRLLTDGWYNG